MPVLAGPIRQADKVPIRPRVPLKLPLHRCGLPQMKIPAVTADGDPCGFGKVNTDVAPIECELHLSRFCTLTPVSQTLLIGCRNYIKQYYVANNYHLTGGKAFKSLKSSLFENCLIKNGAVSSNNLSTCSAHSLFLTIPTYCGRDVLNEIDESGWM